MVIPHGGQSGGPSFSKKVMRKNSRAWKSHWFLHKAQRKQPIQKSTRDIEEGAELDWEPEPSGWQSILALMGKPTLEPSVDEAKSIKLYLECVRERKKSFECLRSIELWTECSEMQSISVERLFSTLPTICRCVRIPGISTEDVLRALVEDGILKASVLACEQGLVDGGSIVLSLIGLFSMLYYIDEYGIRTSIAASKIKKPRGKDISALGEGKCVLISPTFAQQPLATSLQALDECLPHQDVRAGHATNEAFGHCKSSDDTVFASNLNLSTLCRTGQLKIEWTPLIGRHLCIDFASSTLSLFAYPSVCDLFLSQSSLFSSIASSLWENHPHADMLGPQYMQEILRSYDLIFLNERSRRLFVKKHRLDLSESGDMIVDPRLEEMCRSTPIGKFLRRETYSKYDDFPVLSSRITLIHDYIERQRPKRVKTLWQDRRNLLSWYTLWAVLALGLAGLLLSVLQLLFGVMQTVFAYKAYKLQEGSPVSSLMRRVIV